MENGGILGTRKKSKYLTNNLEKDSQNSRSCSIDYKSRRFPGRLQRNVRWRWLDYSQPF
jgi:hypothetical protein